MFGQFEFECEFELDGVVVVVEDEPPDDDPDDDLPLAALAIAAPPTAVALTTRTAASVFCMRVTIHHLLPGLFLSPWSQPGQPVKDVRGVEEASKNRYRVARAVSVSGVRRPALQARTACSGGT
jgi:hypothetical protein